MADVWQENVETGRIVRLALAAEGTAKPTTLPDTGSSLDWTATDSGENVYGWTASTFYLTEDEFSVSDQEADAVEVKPPTLQKRVDEIVFNDTSPDTIEFSTYEIGSKVYAFSTNCTESPAGTMTPSATHTYQALCIEIAGFGLMYFPKVKVTAGTPTAGVKTLGTQACMIKVFGTSSLPSGFTFYQYQDAA